MTEQIAARRVALELLVRNHAGVMSHVCGLFSRRAFNLEAILVLPDRNSDRSTMWLLVEDNDRLGQVCSQLAKLQDVLEIHERDPKTVEAFAPVV